MTARCSTSATSLVVAGDDRRRRHVASHLLGVVRPREGGDHPARLLVDDLARPLERAQLVALGERQLQRARGARRRHPTRHLTDGLGRYRVDEELRGADIRVVHGHERDLCGEGDAGQEMRVLARRLQLRRLLGREGEHLHHVAALDEQTGEGAAPASGSDDRDVHSLYVPDRPDVAGPCCIRGSFARFSLPFSSLRMLPRWAQKTMTMTSTAAILYGSGRRQKECEHRDQHRRDQGGQTDVAGGQEDRDPGEQDDEEDDRHEREDDRRPRWRRPCRPNP